MRCNSGVGRYVTAALVALFSLVLISCGGGESTTSYTVTATAGAGGSISPASATVSSGATANFTVTPSSGNSINTVTGCGGTLAGSTYTTGAVTADCAVTASFVSGSGLPTVTSFTAGATTIPAGSSVNLNAVFTGGTGSIDNGIGGITSGTPVSVTPTTTTTYTLTATNTTGAVTSTVTVNVLGLDALSMTSASLDQSFQASQLAYTATVGFVTSSVTVTATTSNAGATIAVNGVAIGAGNTSQSVALVEGFNPAINIVVTAADLTSTTYTLTIIRQFAAAFAQQAYIKASNTGAGNFSGYGDWFGSSVALSDDGNTLAVGAPGEESAATGIGGDQNDNSAEDSGAVYLFTRSGITWSQQAYIKASNTDAGNQFGHSLALSSNGNILAVNGPSALYLFARSGTAWSQQAYMEAPITSSGGFGGEFALSGDGNILAVTGGGDNSRYREVAVYLFTRSGSVWNQQAYIEAPNPYTRDGFGGSLALSDDGNTLAVAAGGEDSTSTGIGGDQTDNSAINSGAVYLFTRSGTDWSQQAYIKASNTDAVDQFGRSLALSANGNTLAVGTPNEDSSATGIGGDQADNSADFSGAVYLFTRSGTAWSQQAYIKASNTDATDGFGISLALSDDGNALAVGAHGEGSSATGIGGYQTDNSARNRGAMYLFTRSGTAWSQQAYIKSSNTSSSSQFFGASVTLSGDGNTLAAGARLESSAATGIGGSQGFSIAGMFSGAVYVFE